MCCSMSRLISPVLSYQYVVLRCVPRVDRGEQAPGRPYLDGLGQRFGWITAPAARSSSPVRSTKA